jgi:Flp pilus assembly protein TadD
LVLRAHEFGSEANRCLAVAGRLEPREFLWPYIEGVSLTLSDPGEAIALFRRAALLRPSDSLPPIRLGELLLHEGRTEEAVREFQRALVLEPVSARARLGLARCSLIAGNLPECRRLAADAVRLAPGQRPPHELLVQVCRRLGHTKEADSEEQILAQLSLNETTWEDVHVARVLELRRDPQWLAKSAQGLLDAGRDGEAITLIEELVAADDADPDWKVMLGQALFRTRDYARAADVIDRGIVRLPTRLICDCSGASWHFWSRIG